MHLARRIASLAATLFVATVPAWAAESLPRPDALDRSIQSTLRACFARAERDAARSGRPVVPGLSACYQQAYGRWQSAIERAKDLLGADANDPCRRAIDEIEQRWADYVADVRRLDGVSSLPLNTDDDLEVVLRKQLYEMAWSLRSNSACGR
jgi:hypothetical protein